jgi:hypothetical protein
VDVQKGVSDGMDTRVSYLGAVDFYQCDYSPDVLGNDANHAEDVDAKHTAPGRNGSAFLFTFPSSYR